MAEPPSTTAKSGALASPSSTVKKVAQIVDTETSTTSTTSSASAKHKRRRAQDFTDDPDTKGVREARHAFFKKYNIERPRSPAVLDDDFYRKYNIERPPNPNPAVPDDDFYKRYKLERLSPLPASAVKEVRRVSDLVPSEFNPAKRHKKK